ncbi:HAD-IA family hydrolase [Bombilactobacillus folatiphilus]|uniref:HAD-IA family hydrolase n=1 Tax=Bombilactobacillus folatiphilus TaxID=2923362 RepID=A0ABY4P7E8_9LACO|nr:HAD-IA family hydrolase [Bombilactobacillus folatiphilus]UQS81540.1 HAD-IA family hydrolase [Bombilactobacillus folatiphilus]
MMFKNFVWDYDGTLADTYAGIVRSLQQTAEYFGWQQCPERQILYRQSKLTSVTQILKVCAHECQQEFAAVQAYYQKLDHQAQQDVQLYPHAPRVLQTIQQNGGQNFLLTHRDDQALSLLKEQGIYDLFSGFVTASQPFPRKPDPTALNYLMQHFCLEKAETIMIGDRSLDVEAGHNAGITSAYFDVDSFHDSANAQIIVKNLDDLTKLIAK